METKLLEMHLRHYNILLNEKHTQLIKKIHDDFIVKYIFDTINLNETNKITLSKVRTIVETSFYDKNNKEETEINNLINAFKKLDEYLIRKKDITEEQVKDIHNILLENISIGGVYRNLNIGLVDAAHQPPNYLKVYDKMKQLFIDLSEMKETEFIKAIYTYCLIAKIHPFTEYNTNLNMIIFNYNLMKQGYLPLSINITKDQDYITSLEVFKVDDNISLFESFIKRKLNERYEEVIKILDI